MDFSLHEEQEALARPRRADPRRPRHARAAQGARGGRRARSTATRGRELAKAGLLGIALPEDVGGSGLGFLELCLLLEQVGRTVAPLPLLADAGARRAADRRVRHRGAALDVPARRSSPATRSSPPRSSSSAPTHVRPADHRHGATATAGGSTA